MFTLMKVPYDYDALEPAVSAETLKYHHDKHHRGYVDKLNELVQAERSDLDPDQASALRSLVLTSAGEIFHNAAQVWNHDFYWNSLSPHAKPLSATGALSSAIVAQFGSLKALKNAFVHTALRLFGSGWLWLAADTTGVVELLPTSNADNPLRQNMIPLLVCDVWEHAYYIDYRNDREKYLHAFWDIVDWPTAAQHFAEIDTTRPLVAEGSRNRRAGTLSNYDPGGGS